MWKKQPSFKPMPWQCTVVTAYGSLATFTFNFLLLLLFVMACFKPPFSLSKSFMEGDQSRGQEAWLEFQCGAFHGIVQLGKLCLTFQRVMDLRTRYLLIGRTASLSWAHPNKVRCDLTPLSCSVPSWNMTRNCYFPVITTYHFTRFVRSLGMSEARVTSTTTLASRRETSQERRRGQVADRPAELQH